MSEGGKKKKKVRHSNGEAVHFGENVVALEKDEMLKRVYVLGDYSMYFFSSLLPFLGILLRDAVLSQSERRNNQRIAASMTTCKYVCLDEHSTLATTNKLSNGVGVLCVCVCICAFFKPLFPMNTQKMQMVRSCLYVVYGRNQVSWVRLETPIRSSTAYSIYKCVCLCVYCAHVCKL